ncbi:hypothetical protein ACQKC9_07795 [Psychrobacter sp. NPDC078409]|uniref:capsular polysaccharide export protein, LipB/KpsS family n=1 Tax=Psychrobacter sp. NPDC078409 TaxID=3390660 RepID=UPI003D0395C7
MKKIILQLHDIKDPVNYSINFLNKVQEAIGKIEVLILVPCLSQNMINHVNAAFKYKILITNEYLKQDISLENVSVSDFDLQSCQLQQKVFEKIGKMLPFQSIIKSHIAYSTLYKKIIENYAPDFCVCWNGQVHIDQTTFRDTCSNLNLDMLFLERGLIPNSVFYDSEGVNATSSVAKWDIKEYKDTDHKESYGLLQDYLKKEGVAVVKVKQKRQKFLIPYVLFPLQRDSDSNLVSNSKYFKNMYTILKQIDQSDLPIPVHYRAHPEDPKSHYTKSLNFKNKYLEEKSNIDLEQHLMNSAAVMTINSTIGFSALLKDKIVITLGESLYADKGFTIDYKDYRSFQKILTNIDQHKLTEEMKEMKDKFVSKVITERHLVFNSSRLSFIQTNNLKNYIDCVLGEQK